MNIPEFIPKVLSRFMVGLPLLVFGILHFMQAQNMAGLVPKFIPGGIIWVYITGLFLILGAVGIMANQRYGKLAALLAGILVLSFALTIHLVNTLGGNAASLSQFLKDTAIAGGLFALTGLLND
ncbi:MAG TPA: DoxX family protein [Anaerolineae bacterium]|nr:DoxX family protein [Anaerolineae bacterium]